MPCIEPSLPLWRTEILLEVSPVTVTAVRLANLGLPGELVHGVWLVPSGSQQLQQPCILLPISQRSLLKDVGVNSLQEAAWLPHTGSSRHI